MTRFKILKELKSKYGLKEIKSMGQSNKQVS